MKIPCTQRPRISTITTRTLILLPLLFALLQYVPAAAAPSTKWTDHAKWGLPAKTSIIERDKTKPVYFITGFNKRYKAPKWVAYRLNAEDVADLTDRPPGEKWNYDPAIDDKYEAPEEAFSTTWHRGHFCPYLHRRWSEAAYKSTFFYTNCAPQLGGFNGGRWAQLEGKVSDWTAEDKHGKIWVYTGTLYKTEPGKPLETTPEGGMKIPTHFWCVVFDPDPEPQVIAFLYENKKGGKEWKKSVVSVDTIEKLSGLNFLRELNDETENTIEAQEQGVGEWY
jgi:endonuclease G